MAAMMAAVRGPAAVEGLDAKVTCAPGQHVVQANAGAPTQPQRQRASGARQPAAPKAAGPAVQEAVLRRRLVLIPRSQRVARRGQHVHVRVRAAPAAEPSRHAPRASGAPGSLTGIVWAFHRRRPAPPAGPWACEQPLLVPGASTKRRSPHLTAAHTLLGTACGERWRRGRAGRCPAGWRV